jgi:hypothetical protein
MRDAVVSQRLKGLLDLADGGTFELPPAVAKAANVLRGLKAQDVDVPGAWASQQSRSLMTA